MKYKVLIQHFGDKQYYAGESREVANDHDAKELIGMGLIAQFDDDGDSGGGGKQGENEQDNPPAEPKAKAKAPPKNKAEPAPQNKADDNGQGE
ncbi:MAG: hypothetical protein ACTTG4_05060 [Moraxella sp.]